MRSSNSIVSYQSGSASDLLLVTLCEGWSAWVLCVNSYFLRYRSDPDHDLCKCSRNVWCLTRECLTPRVKCSKNETENNYLTMRILSPTCQLKSSVEADIVSIKRQVRDLEAKVDDILNLLRKPTSGEGMFTHNNLSDTIRSLCKRIKAREQGCN